MDKNVLYLLGAVGALTSVGSAQAEAAAIDNAHRPAASYADLLKPIPNALDVLRSEAALAVAAPETEEPVVEEVQYFAHHHHHHHHRYHRYYRRWFHRHYHHHHHY